MAFADVVKTTVFLTNPNDRAAFAAIRSELTGGSKNASSLDAPIKAWSAFMDKYYPDGDKEDGYAIFGYAAAETMVQVLTPCGDDLSRENIMRQAASLKNYLNPVALPGIAINTSSTDFRPIKQLVQLDGNVWQPIGDVIDSAFLNGPGNN